MKYIDIHSHVQFHAYDEDRTNVITRTIDSETGMINVGTQFDTSKSAVKLANQNANSWATIGLHPVHTSASYHDAQELNPDDPDTKGFTSRGEAFEYSGYLELGRDTKVVGIGECGLDYYRLTPETQAIQKKVFEQHIELANELGKPLMLHIRNGKGMSGGGAYDDALEIVKSLSKVSGDVHFFAGDWETAKKWIDIGFTLSFTGVITFTRDYDEVVKNTPIDMMMTETDSPYITPAPHRGKRNEPMHVRYVVEKIAEIKGIDVEEVRIQILNNAKRVFSLI